MPKKLIPPRLKIKKWDDCYTFFLKYFSLFNEYKEVESDEFMALVERQPFRGPEQLRDKDTLVFRFGRMNKNTRIILQGRRLKEAEYEMRNHFVIFRNPDNLIDLTYLDRENYIRKRSLTEVDIESYTQSVDVITFSALSALPKRPRSVLRTSKR